MAVLVSQHGTAGQVQARGSSRWSTSALRAPVQRRSLVCRAGVQDLDLTGVVKAGAAALAALPATIALDGLLDKAQNRVAAITNTDASGVRCFTTYPAGYDATGQEKKPAVILIHQILGVQMREVNLCKDLADKGYVAVAPDTFQGRATLWPFRALYLGYQAAFKEGATWGVPDLHKVVQWLRDQPGVDPSRIVISGFCYGGGAAVRYAAAHPGTVAGVTIFYGRPLSEASDVAKLGTDTRLLAIYGTRDSQFPAPMIDKFEADLRAAGTPYQLERFEELGHAFVKDIEAVRQGGPAGRAWGLFSQFLKDTLIERQ